jgi:hypothetical protein
MRKYWVRVVDFKTASHVIIYDRKTRTASWYNLLVKTLVMDNTLKYNFENRVQAHNKRYFPITRNQYIRAKLTGVIDDFKKD